MIRGEERVKVMRGEELGLIMKLVSEKVGFGWFFVKIFGG